MRKTRTTRLSMHAERFNSVGDWKRRAHDWRSGLRVSPPTGKTCKPYQSKKYRRSVICRFSTITSNLLQLIIIKYNVASTYFFYGLSSTRVILKFNQVTVILMCRPVGIFALFLLICFLDSRNCSASTQYETNGKISLNT